VFDYALLMVFPALLAFGAAYDLLTMTIPNRVSIALVLLFLLAAPIAGLSAHDMLLHVGAGLLVLAASIVLFALGGFGGGDAKLLAAASLWIGFDQLLPFLLNVTIFGGLLALLILAYRRLPFIGPHAPTWALNLYQRGTGIPYGIAIAASALMIFPSTDLVATALA